MNDSYYNNPTENITSSNHCAGLLTYNLLITYMKVQMTVIKETWTTIEPITRTRIASMALIKLTKIVTSICQKKIKEKQKGW